ncbi:aminotransferase class I/II-fold pyridoxal phosphate-dependent enzyme [Lactiplantibacillus argentoratensis]|uniref:aminotransferase class I/II-fold pyridoxal phosphate-dependent enzyme n=1 Tax=Lactiplantibacillus argentoratensis TaxID=271881 RepID=UPI001BDCB130|nr:aminotransferase class I/II-fold pyridoxal phosphate-dependent enzyme [Lactiplantibacillus argentoratensis]MBT1142862.1 aminotransferase class I/II-fold pyridoxal phosphate-dependent enzyme [Lactiplantibacillus argentoratensis]MBT1145722.1 aminotransferase class I/II-fold pyridoxal phosphate-dependent enzyme [Lactiplantibacillus argentoratensis]MBT1148477.1 aminotransferase class I/II-fold pyridoxal phosphate-dependent enzyme [Lactiplantibacillus argentoratensis]MBT1153192.1 aminotransferase
MSINSETLVSHMNHEIAAIQPSDILAFNAEIANIPGIVRLTLGEPDFNTPEHIKQAAIKSIEADESHYAPSNGTLALRTAAAEFLATKYDVHYDPASEVIITAGATGGIYTALSSILNPGDEVLIPTPIFPLYIAIVKLAGATPVFMDTSDNGFVLSPDQLQTTLAAHPKTKAVVLNFPSNPTGVTYRHDDLKALAAVLADQPIFVLSDEIYSELTYGERHESIANYLPAQTILLNGVSKSHAMTGWRIGIMCAPKAITAQLGKIHQFTVTSTTTNAQAAATEALKNGLDDAQVMKREYQKRRDYLYDALNELGFQSAKPEGAFYLFSKIPAGLPQDSMAFCRELAHEARVALIPGSSFGPGGEGYVRISYAASMSDLKTAVTRIKTYVASKKQGA